MDGTEDENKHLYVKTPSIFQMIKSFTVEVSKYIAKGAPTVTQEDYVERLDDMWFMWMQARVQGKNENNNMSLYPLKMEKTRTRW